MEAYNRDTVQKSIRMPVDIAEKIEKMAREQERDFAKQVNFMLRKYIEIQENMK